MQTLSANVSSPSKSTEKGKIKSSLLFLLTVSAGIIVSNLFASQPIVAEISASIGMPSQLAGLVSTLTMLGYATGVVFLLPLTDRLENRRLILGTLTASVLALLGASYARGAATFLCAVFLVGVTSCTLQILTGDTGLPGLRLNSPCNQNPSSPFPSNPSGARDFSLDPHGTSVGKSCEDPRTSLVQPFRILNINLSGCRFRFYGYGSIINLR